MYHDGEDGDDDAADVATPVTGVSNGMAGMTDISRYYPDLVALPSVPTVFSFEFLGDTNTRGDRSQEL